MNKRSPSDGSEGTERPAPVPPEVYDRAYYLEDCEGYELFIRTAGKRLPLRLEGVFHWADVRAGMHVLDVGTGRGELVWRCATEGAFAVGIDYAPAALEIASEGREQEAGRVTPVFSLSDGCALPFRSAAFDRVFMADLVEHLHPWQLERALDEAYRVLVTQGMLIIHTSPNLWYYRYGYPLFRLFEALRGNRLPRDPRDRYVYHKEAHVNEQSLLSLRRSLRQAGFRRHRMWLERVNDWERPVPSPLLRFLARFALDVYPFRWFFRNELYALAWKQ
ncbi:MAG TPA: class I SAM-dependent methyltransferase [Anaerolineae bacterium]|nr:class I SAM-dependent methyltransferase [Anaerolineae bacterium]